MNLIKVLHKLKNGSKVKGKTKVVVCIKQINFSGYTISILGGYK